MPEIRHEIDKLNDEQREAVSHPDSVVVLAGPGSGKTATLVLKVATLLDGIIPAPQGLACVTYNNEAAKEFRTRLQSLRMRGSTSHAFLGTVHSFCLNAVIRPFAHLVDDGGSEFGVATRAQADDALQLALDRVGINKKVDWFKTTLTCIRRAQACGEPTRGFGDDELQAATVYDDLLGNGGLIDFEGMVLKALHLIRTEPVVCDLLACRFPWLIVDEYQDLGGPLHQIVLALRDTGKVRVFAVGDPHQSIYSFTGADPRYLRELGERPDFHQVELKFNYRSGRRLIAASHVTLSLDTPPDHRPDPKRKDPGEIFVEEIDGGAAGQLTHIVSSVLPALFAQGIEAHEIAILYKQKGAFLDDLQEALADADIDFDADRALRFSRGPLIRWLQACAQWATRRDEEETSETFTQLADEYLGLCYDAGIVDRGEQPLHLRARLYTAIESFGSEDAPLTEWLEAFAGATNLEEILDELDNRSDDTEDYKALKFAASTGQALGTMTLREFGDNGRTKGKVVITTYHSSKGRQFDAVILPMLQERVLPSWKWNPSRRTFEQPTAKSVADDRRLFYVGMTRARRFVHLVYSHHCKDDKGYALPEGPSRFVSEIQAKLSDL